MHEKILERMKRGVYYAGHQLGPRAELERLVAQGYLERMDASFCCGPDSEPTYCRAAPKPPPTRHAPTDETDR